MTTISALGRRAFLASGGAALLLGRAGWPAIAEPALRAADLEALRLRYGLPGAAALVLRGGAVVADGAAGVRSVTGQDPILLPHPFVIGSCGKSMTATVAARLVARGTLRFETTLQEAFPELSPEQPAYRGMSVAALLAHRGGISAVPPIPLPLAGDPAAERARALPVILALPPQGIPGRNYLYSNLGYVLVGAMLDRLTGTPYESLATAELFQPLGMVSAGFPPRPPRKRPAATPSSGCPCRRTCPLTRRPPRAPPGSTTWRCPIGPSTPRRTSASAPRATCRRSSSPGCTPPGTRRRARTTPGVGTSPRARSAPCCATTAASATGRRGSC